ncbi:transposase 1 domain protein, partial [Acinetobacter baumannii 916567]
MKGGDLPDGLHINQIYWLMREADREFIGEQWFTWLIEQDINFCIRVKKTSLSPI